MTPDEIVALLTDAMQTTVQNIRGLTAERARLIMALRELRGAIDTVLEEVDP